VNFIINGITVATFDFTDGSNVNDNEEYFFGVIAGPGEVVEEVTLTGYSGLILYDNLAYATEPESVPEPTSVIGLLGIGALGALSRKRKS
jgi:hypothetical protein